MNSETNTYYCTQAFPSPAQLLRIILCICISPVIQLPSYSFWQIACLGQNENPACALLTAKYKHYTNQMISVINYISVCIEYAIKNKKKHT